METVNNDLAKISEDDVRSIILAGLSAGIPKVGGIVSALVGIMWPTSGVDYWEEVKEQVEELIDEKIEEDVYNRVFASLEGLQNSVNLYIDRVEEAEKDNDVSAIYIQCISTLNSFATSEPLFRQQGHELLLLSLYTQMMNLYLTVLSDLVNDGINWGADAAEIETRKGQLQDLIEDGVTYCDDWIETGRVDLGLKEYDEIDYWVDWNNHNKYMRGMILAVSDYTYFWPYFYSENGTPPAQTREIYSNPSSQTIYSTEPDYTLFTLPSYALMGSMDRVRAFARSDYWIYGIEVTYGDDVVMLGVSESSSELIVDIDAIIASDNKVVKVNVSDRGGNIFYLKFTFEDGTSIDTRYQSPYDYDNSEFEFEGQVVSSIRSLEVRDDTQSGLINKITFGFRFKDSY